MSFEEELATRLLRPGEIEAEAVAVLRLIVRHAGRGKMRNDYLFEWAEIILARYDRARMNEHEASNVVPFKRG